MTAAEQKTALDPISAGRRRTIGLATIVIAMVLTTIICIQDCLYPNTGSVVHCFIAFACLGLEFAIIALWGVTAPVFVMIVLSQHFGLIATLFFPASHGAHVLVFFSAVPLFYMVGGTVKGRIASASFLLLTLVLAVLKLAGVVQILNLTSPRDTLLAAIACVFLQVFIAEFNERGHQARITAVLDRQFREPNSGLPNWNALSHKIIEPGHGLALVKFGNLAFQESWQPGHVGRALAGLISTTQDLYWIAEDTYVILESGGRVSESLQSTIVDHFLPSEFAGLRSHSMLKMVGVHAGDKAEAARTLLVEAELQLAVGTHHWHPGAGSKLRVRELIQDLGTTFRERKMSALFQPIYDHQAGGICIFEGLTRLNVDGQEVSPEPYLSLIESLGLDLQLTEFILGETVRIGLMTDYSVSLNLTYRDLEDTKLLPKLLEACSQFRNRTNKLILELTEHIAFADPQLITRFIGQVHEAGGLVFLDDFGMGFSNYASIVAAHFDGIKVAGSIVRDAPINEELRVLLSGIAKFARASKIALIAEHISDDTIHSLVQDENIRYLQGFLIQKPLPGHSILDGSFELAFGSEEVLLGGGKTRSVPFVG